MHGWTTNRHERYVSTMLTESDLSIALLVQLEMQDDKHRRALRFPS